MSVGDVQPLAGAAADAEKEVEEEEEDDAILEQPHTAAAEARRLDASVAASSRAARERRLQAHYLFNRVFPK